MNRRGFSIVELLVITAVILVLAAVLGPVFSKVGPATAEQQGLANMTHISQSMHLYYHDYDQVRMGRQSVDANQCLSWKQVLDPYVSQPAYFINPGNPAARYADAFSDDAVRMMICPSAGYPLGGHRTYKRGYYWNNLFGQRGPSYNHTYWDNPGMALSQVASPSTTGDLTEGKGFWDDQGPFSMWGEDVDSETSWLGSAAPVTGLKWANSASHYKDTGMNVAMVDGHAKAVRFQQICDPWISVNPATGVGTVVNSKYLTFWNFSADGITSLGMDATWMLPAVQNYCISRVKVSSKPSK